MKYFNIPIFVPHLGCPFDCVFCNQRKITGADSNVDEKTVRATIEEHLKFLPSDGCEIEIAFFGGSFTGITPVLQEELLSAAYEYVGRFSITGIRVSTRPDYIDEEVISRLLKYGVTTVELGVQSMDDEVLRLSSRGHTREDVKKAAELIKKSGIRLGLQMMTGLPGDTEEKSLKTAREIIALKPAMVRIYPTLVIAGTMLEKLYKERKYTPQTVESAAELCKKLCGEFAAADIAVIRVGLQNTDEISEHGSVIAGPFHSAFGEIVESLVFYDKIAEAAKITDTVYVNPRDVSKAVGHKKSNTERIYREFNKKITIKPDTDVMAGEIRIR